MASIHRRRPWSRRPDGGPPILEKGAWLRRRELLALLVLGGALAGLAPRSLAAALRQGEPPDAEAAARKKGFSLERYPKSERWVPEWEPASGRAAYPAPRNPAFRTAGRILCPEDRAATHNNFYEFLPGKAGAVHRHAEAFEARPWPVEIAGLVEEPRAVDVDELAAIAPLEERVYRHRCVEAWSMVVPWTGVPLAAFVAWCRPKPEARFLKLTSFLRPEQAPGQRKADHYPWPYYEALRLDEARHPLAFLVTGIYGHGLPVQHGAPLRIAVPWKYGYKSAKSFVRVDFTAEQPGTFWNDLQPAEYGFLSNVDPATPHPRWSQATERDLATGDRIPTEPYNGYGDLVAHMYR